MEQKNQHCERHRGHRSFDSVPAERTLNVPTTDDTQRGLNVDQPDTKRSGPTNVSSPRVLSSPPDYIGDDACIANTYGEQVVKLAAAGIVRCDEQHLLLCKLDMNLLALRERDVDGYETAALAGTYQNLRRTRADI